MKFNWKDDDQKYIKLGLTAFAVVVLSILANQVLHQIPLLTVGVKTLLGCLKPIAYGLVFAYLLTPLLNMFERWLFRLKFFDKGNTKSFRLVRGISVVLAWGVMICVVAVLIKLVVPEILSSIQGIIDNMPVYIITLRRWVSRLLEGNPDIRDWIMTQIGKFYTDFTSVAGSFPEFVDKISKFMPRVGQRVKRRVQRGDGHLQYCCRRDCFNIRHGSKGKFCGAGQKVYLCAAPNLAGQQPFQNR